MPAETIQSKCIWACFIKKQPIYLYDVKCTVKLESEQLIKEDASYKEYTQ